jgi:hypothetical protein
MQSKIMPVVLFTLILAAPCFAAGEWVDISSPIVKQLTDAGKKIAWPGQSAGVAVDPSTGDVYMIIPDQGIWKSSDRGATFGRCDKGEISGRCETGYSINVDPAGGGRLACFMLDGKCAMTLDGGKTWRPFKDVGRNWDFAAVDWSAVEPQHIFAARHESGGEMYYSNDGGKSWTQIAKDPKFFSVGIFDAKILVTTKGDGILRSTDAGQSWEKVSDLEPTGRVVRIYKSRAYWLGKDGLLISNDLGKTWKRQGGSVGSGWGPFFGADEKHIVVVGRKGFFESRDAGESWQHAAAFPGVKGFDEKMPGWFVNIAWDPKGDVFYASRMGMPTYKFERR